MEILKKDILKEMEKKSQENLDKGIDIAVSILKNEFPFVTGWKYKDDPNFFNSTVYIMLICDMDKSSEFYNSPIKDYYKNLEADATYPFSPLEMSNEKDNDEKYELYKEIQKSLDETYYEIPNDYRHTFKSYGSNTDQPKEIYIDGFVFPAPEKLSESESSNNKVSLAKSLIYELFNEVSFIQQSTYYNRPSLTVYFDSDDTAANIESYFTREICDTLREYTSGEILCNPSWGPEWKINRNNTDILIDAILLEYDNEGDVLNEDYSPAGKEVTPNKIVVHKTSPVWRENILKTGLQVSAGECYKIYVGYGTKCKPAIFATNSTNKRSWFDSTYDDDIWFIDTTMIPDVKWYKDRHFESTKKHIVTFQDIPKDALTLFYKGTGKSEDLINESEEETTNYIPIIEEIIEPFKNEDCVCEINVWYDEEDDMYSVYLVLGTEELNGKFYYVDGIRTYRNKLARKIETEIKSYLPIDNLYVGSYGIPNFGWKPLNESKNKSTKDLIERVLNTLVLPQYEHVICGFELKNVDDESLNNVINYPGVTVTFIGGYGTKMWPQTQAVQKMYDDVLDDIWDTIYNYTGISVELYSKYVKDCKESINENWLKVPSSDYNSLEKIINLEMKEKYSWLKDIKINTLNYIDLYGDVQIEAELTVDEEWGANQWGEFYYNVKFPGNKRLGR
jgi:hypothetical protein